MNLKEILKSFLPNDLLNLSCHLTQRIISSFNLNTASCDETQDFKMCLIQELNKIRMKGIVFLLTLC